MLAKEDPPAAELGSYRRGLFRTPVESSLIHNPQDFYSQII